MKVLVKNMGDVVESWEATSRHDADRTASLRLADWRRTCGGHFDPIYTVEVVDDDGKILSVEATRSDDSWLFRS